MKETHLKHTSKILPKLIEAFEKRFEKYLSLSTEVNDAILAACFNPMFKLRWINHNHNDYQRIFNLCQNIIDKTENGESPLKQSSEEEDFFEFNQEETKNTKNNLEFANYLESKNKSLTMLNNFKTIRKLFIQYN